MNEWTAKRLKRTKSGRSANQGEGEKKMKKSKKRIQSSDNKLKADDKEDDEGDVRLWQGNIVQHAEQNVTARETRKTATNTSFVVDVIGQTSKRRNVGSKVVDNEIHGASRYRKSRPVPAPC